MSPSWKTVSLAHSTTSVQKTVRTPSKLIINIVRSTRKNCIWIRFVEKRHNIRTAITAEKKKKIGRYAVCATALKRPCNLSAVTSIHLSWTTRREWRFHSYSSNVRTHFESWFSANSIIQSRFIGIGDCGFRDLDDTKIPMTQQNSTPNVNSLVKFDNNNVNGNCFIFGFYTQCLAYYYYSSCQKLQTLYRRYIINELRLVRKDFKTTSYARSYFHSKENVSRGENGWKLLWLE